MRGPPLVLYDGLCALCNHAVRFLVRIDRRGVLRYAPLGGATAGEATSGLDGLGGVDSVVLIEFDAEGRAHAAVRSAAVLGALRAVGGFWRGVAALLAAVPRGLRDRVYDVVAARRSRWFGRLDRCPAPPPAARGRFLP